MAIRRNPWHNAKGYGRIRPGVLRQMSHADLHALCRDAIAISNTVKETIGHPAHFTAARLYRDLHVIGCDGIFRQEWEKGE